MLPQVGHKILVVDHERDLVATCVRLLSSRQYAGLAAYTGRHAIDLITREQPVLVVTDLSLPDISGLDVLRHAREQAPPIPGIIMTGYQSPVTMDFAYDVGARLYLPKPFSNAAFLGAIERVLPRG